MGEKPTIENKIKNKKINQQANMILEEIEIIHGTEED